jgi:MoxR-like ATPase
VSILADPGPYGWSPRTQQTLNQFDSVARRLSARHVGRDQAIRLIQLALICREHVLLLGPPGTAKTDLVTRFADLLHAQHFSYLLTRFTEPSEIFGPLDFSAFRASTYQVRTEGMLPSAEIAFLDEIFQGSSAILNSLLTLINERVFHNGPKPTRAPLITVIGAANDLPDDPVLDAFADRFLLRIELHPVAGSMLPDLISVGWEREQDSLRAPRASVLQAGAGAPAREDAIMNVADLAELSARVAEVEIKDVQAEYEAVIRQLLSDRVTLSDRRVVRGLKLVAGAALLRRSKRAQPQDLWPLNHFWTDPADADRFREVVQPRVEAAGGQPLRAVRNVRAIVQDAEIEFRQTLGASSGRPSPIALERALGRLNELSQELAVAYPRAPEQQQIRAWINQLIDQLPGSS